jgi:DHA2 family methylenomycin A resistance protein-like MFS transporter
MTTALLGTVGQQRAGTASAVLNTARQAAGAIGVAAFGALAGHGDGGAGGAAAQIVDAVRGSAMISVALLLCAAWTARQVSNPSGAGSSGAAGCGRRPVPEEAE